MKRDRFFLIAVQGDFVIFSALLGFIFSQFCSAWLFPVLSMIAGSIGGSQFVLANKVLFGEKDMAGKIGGLSYGIDLLGSFLGAVLTGIFLIPILGMPKTCFVIAAVNLAVLAILLINVSVEE
jgi:predicted membrane-bound spermidine synthase